MIKVVSNCFQDVINLAARIKNHIDDFPIKVYGNNLQTTSSCFTSISLIESINCLIWSSGETSLSRSNFGRSFLGCLGKGYWAPGTSMASTTRQGQLAAILDLKLKFCLGDGIVVSGRFVLGGLGGPEPPAWGSGKS